MQTLSNIYTGGVLWVKILLLGIFIFGFGLLLYFLFGRKSFILKALSGVFSKLSPGEEKTALQVNEQNTSTKVPYESLPTNSSATKTLSLMEEALKALEEKESR